MKRTALASMTITGLILLTACGQNDSTGANEGGTWTPPDTLEIAVGAQPGGGSDILGRAFASGVEEITGSSAVVENYDTVEGVILLKSETGNADLVGVGNYSNMVVRPHEQDLGYSWQDFTQLALVAEDVSYVVSQPGAFESAED